MFDLFLGGRDNKSNTNHFPLARTGVGQLQGSLKSPCLVKLTTWSSHGAHGHRLCHLRPSQWSARAQHEWTLMRRPAGWQECRWVKGVYTVRTFSPFSSQPTGPFWKNPPWDPLSKAVPFPSLCLIHGLYHYLKLPFSYSVYLFIEYHTQNCYTTMRTLAPFFPHRVLRCVTVPAGHRHSTSIGCINKEFRQTLEVLWIRFQTRPPQ